MTDSRSPSTEEVIRSALNVRLMDLHTALPGRVESYDAATQTANIKPLIKRTFIAEETEVVEEIPIINDVPVVFPRGGGFFLSFPLEVGDHVLLVFNERSIDKFVSGSGNDTDPVDLRMHNLTDAVAHAGFYPASQSLGDADSSKLVIGKDGGMQIKITPSDVVEIGDAAKHAVKYEDLKTEYDAHTHPTGVGPSGVTVPMTTAVRAATVKLPST